MTITQQTPPGWYPDPEGNGLRYFDGTQWTDHRSGVHQTPPPQQQPMPPYGNGNGFGGPPPVVNPHLAQARPPKKSNTWKWVVGGIAALFVIGAIASGSSSTSTDNDEGGKSGSQVASNGKKSEKAEKETKAKKDPENVEKPEAKPKPPAQPAEPEMTSGQENALESAQNYVDMSGFSKKGLIQQLSSSAGEGFSRADATFAAKHVDVNWKEEAVESAQGYLDMGSFSREGLIEQLSSSAGEGFTLAQAQYAVDKVY